MASKADSFISLGDQLVDWCQFYLCHGPGDLRGEDIIIDHEFYAFFLRAYALDLSGRRKINRAFFSRPKGRAKSELAGMIACAELLGPVRFSHWARRDEESVWGYKYKPGEPVGKPVRDPFIRCLATEEGQAGNTYDNVVVMLEHVVDHFSEDFPKIDVGLTRIFVAGGGEIRPSTSASASKDGGKETFAVADETHLWAGTELRAMHDTVTRNLVKRKIAEPWMLETSTMYQPGQGSVAEATHDYWREIKAGHIKNRGLLFDHSQGTIPEDWDDDDAMIVGLKEAYGAAGEWMDFERILGEIRDPKSSRASSVRYFFNRAESEEEKWVTPDIWRAQAVLGPPPEEGTAIALGFDGSETKDNTALIGVTMTGEPHFFVLGIWKRPGGPAGENWTVPRDEVNAAVEFAFEQYAVARMVCDPPYWRDELAKWSGKYGEANIFELSTHSWGKMAKVVDRFDTLISTSVTAPPHTIFTHDGDPDFEEHITNCHKQYVNKRRPEIGFVLTKDKKNSPHKIDAAIAAALACEARGTAIEHGWKVKEELEVWASWD